MTFHPSEYSIVEASISASCRDVQAGSLRSPATDKNGLSEPPEPTVGENVSRAIGGPAWGIHFAMRPHRHFPASFLEIFDQLFTGLQLGPGRLVTVKIAHKANPEADVVHVITVDV